LDLPDQIVYWRHGPIVLNATILFSWIVMAGIVLVSWLITRRLTSSPEMSRGQNLLEIIVRAMQSQIRDITQQDPAPYLPFVGTLFLFVAVCNVLAAIPRYKPPMGSLSTTAGLALCVFVAVPYFGIASRGLKAYLRQYIEPNVFMLPFTITGELSRTVALAFRLFGNVMSGSMIAGVLLAFAPLFVPIPMLALGLLTGLIQAYIFAVLAIVYIASGTGAHTTPPAAQDEQPQGDG